MAEQQPQSLNIRSADVKLVIATVQGHLRSSQEHGDLANASCLEHCNLSSQQGLKSHNTVTNNTSEVNGL